MATKIQKQITLSKKKLKTVRTKFVRFLKKPDNKKYVIIAVVLVVGFFAWQAFGKTATTTTNPAPIPGPGTKTPDPTNDNTPGTPGTVTQYPPSNGVMSPKLASFSDPDHINMQVTGSSKNWVFHDTAVIDVQPGYHISYFINTGETASPGGPISNKAWKSNFPITFQKAVVKDGVDDLYFWGTTDTELQREGDGQVMSGNTSVAYQTFYFNRF